MPQKLRCRVTDILDHGERVYSVFLKPEKPAPRFLPGQFLHLALDEYNPGDFWPDSRSFSIANAPAERQHLRITYAVKGQFTGRMEAELRPGREGWVKLPYGEFIVNAEKDVCLLAGGTGVTAFTAFLAGLPAEHPHHVYLFYGARRTDLLIYRPLVESAAVKCPNLHSYFLIEEGEAPGWFSGRINLDLIWQTLPNPQAVKYYLSGPPIMLKTLSAAFAERRIPANRILTDAWE
ncbi:MAG: FAD-dependent oxidoreductase [Candidatus Atribacteria bacterium]|nr:FAD-dependent oxidoreductase [Candidatus Atribacteria bacterium]